jgi:hypothetical protein
MEGCMKTKVVVYGNERLILRGFIVFGEYGGSQLHSTLVEISRSKASEFWKKFKATRWTKSSILRYRISDLRKRRG